MSSDAAATAEDFANQRRERLKAALRAKAQRERKYPLSFAQQRLWLLEQLEPGNPVYNIPLAVHIRGPIRVEVLNRVLSEVVARHESLRTKIGLSEDQPVQIVEPAIGQQVTIVDLEHLPAEDRLVEAMKLARAEARRPFRLEQGRLLRATLLRLSADDHLLVAVMHHIISDDWSVGVLFREVAILYKALAAGQPAPLEKPPIQYADFTVWQREHLQGATLERLLAYWRGRLEGVSPLELPTDRPRPPLETHAGAVESLLLPRELTYALKEIARHEGATLYMVLLAAFQVLLSRYSGQDDIAVGSPIAGRLRKETEALVGFFANTLVMRTNLAGNPTFRALLRQVRQSSLEAYQHQEIPLERLVEALNPPRDPSRHPLFQVIFTLQNAPWPEVRFEELTLAPLPIDSGVAKLELWLSMRETPAGLQSDLEYNVALFDADTAARMLQHFQMLLEAVAADADQPISRLALMTPAERRQVLVEWNDTARDYHSTDCLHQLVEGQARRTPEAVAVDCEGQQLTYQQLDAQTNQLARYLVRRGVGPDVAVGVCQERSLDLVVSLLAILKAGGAYAPLDPDYPAERLAFMVRDSRPAVVLTTAALADRLPGGDAPLVLLDQSQEEIAQESAQGLPSRNSQDDIAYVIYTSGSTGTPKGVRNTHRGICNRLLWMQEAYGLTAEDRVLQKTPFSFDVSVWEFFWPLLSGARLVLARPGGHKDPRYLAELIVAQEITTLHFVPSMLRVFLAEERSAQCRSLKRVICSGEALPYEVQEQFFARLGAELHNLYGPTEAAVDVTFWQCRPNARGLVPIGKPIANMQCYILDSQQNPLPVGIPGELHLGGVGLARDYLNRPELTAEKFIPHPFSAQPGARLYRTGDLCRYLPDGNIVFLGRIDQQVKIRGNRIELGEIQATLLKHPGVREAAVTAWDDGAGGKELAAYWVANQADTAPKASALREFLQASLPDYMIPAAFVPLESIPLSSNGKVNYKALPRPVRQRDAQAEYVAPRTPEEEQLAAIWQEVLHVDRIGVHDNFFALGGHSLLAIQVISRITHRLHADVPLREIFQTPTIAELAPRLAAAAAAPGQFIARPPVVPVPREGNLPLSFNQEALWFLAHLERHRASYTIYPTLRVHGPLNLPVLERALKEIARRHEVLRTRFPEIDGQPIQVIEPYDDWSLPVIDLSHLPRDQRESEVRQCLYEEMGRPLDLQKGPLTRIAVLRLGPEEFVVTLAAHHIIYDGWSLAVMLRELTAIYGSFLAGGPSPLPELPVQYADFAVWQRNYLRGEILQEHRDFWTKQLAGLPPLELPTDYPRPAVRSTRGDVRPCHLSPSLSSCVAEFSRRERVTPFMTLLAALAVVLQRYSGQSDISIGTPVANRLQPEIEALIGYFVNVIVLRLDLSGDLSFRDVVARVRQVALDALAHQELTLDQVVDAVKPPRDPSRNPLFQVMFALQNNEEPVWEGMGLRLELFEDQPIARSENFELTLNLRETEQGFRGGLSFNTDLFAADSAGRMADNYKFLLSEVLADPQRPLSQIPLVDQPQREVFAQWNDTARQFDRSQPVSRLFEAQAKQRPRAAAVVFREQRWSYRELNGRANQLARYLRRQGVGPETAVGVFMQRSPELIMAVLAVLKAGGALVPLDPGHAGSAPQRLRFMLQDAHVSLVLSEPSLAGQLEGIDAPVVVLEGETAREIQTENRRNLAAKIAAESLAYVLYTSGSTGQPKGVMVTQGNLLNAYHGWEEVYQLAAVPTAHLQMASFGFDVFMGDLVRALCSGGTLVICRKEMLLDPAELLALLRRERVGIAEFVPAVLQTLVQFLEQSGQSLDFMRLVVVGSDAWHVVDHQRALRVVGPKTRLINSYGLTETTIDSSYFEGEVSAASESGLVPIGRPIPNVRLYVLDEHLRPTPIGVAGELYIAGDGVARGYTHSELNAARFVADPFAAGKGRMCRSGDRARWRADGQVEFLGRTDNQVKIRGFRIEPGEVEQVLLQHPQVANAAVVPRQRSSGDLQLVAYFAARSGTVPDPVELKQFLAERLPAFMIPGAFVSLPALPVNSSGKVDRRALPDPDWNRATPQGEFVAPRTTTEEQLAAIWSELLKLDRVSVHDNFFDLGGHSLLALRLVSRIRAALGVEVPLLRLFTSPTIAGLAAVVDRLQEGGDLDSLDAGPPVNWEAETRLDPTIRVTDDLQPAAATPTRILLTGASGFLGAFLLRELLEQTPADVYCLVRASSADEGRKKIVRNLARYEIPAGDGSRIVPVCGDLAEPMLGLSEGAFAELARSIDAIYHNGARVSSVYPYALLRAANVTGTAEVLRLATRTKIKPVHFISTLSVFDAPEYQLEKAIDENRPLTHVGTLVSGYAQSKCVAEKLVQAAGARGLPVAVYRPGRIAADSQTGAANTGDETTILIKLCIELGMAPAYRGEVNMTPVDYVARGIVALAGRGESLGKTFHLTNPQQVAVRDIYRAIRAAGHPLDEVPFARWRQRVIEHGAHSQNELLSGLAHLLLVAVPPEALIEGEPEAIPQATIECVQTLRSLKPAAVRCPKVDDELLSRYFQFLGRREVLPSRPR